MTLSTRPSRDATCLAVAEVIARRSTCSRLAVGVVIAREGRILSTGYNGAPAGMPHCIHDDDEPCDVSVHAEANAIAYAARWGISLEGATLYSTHSPCLTCCKLIVNSGICRVLFWQHFREKDGLVLLRKAGITWFRFEPPETYGTILGEL